MRITIMKKHNGMRPQDIVILLKIASFGKKQWLFKDLAFELNISQSEVSESLNRNMIAGLVSGDKKKLIKGALKEFISYGLKYVFPQKPGPLVRGMATAVSAPPLNTYFQSQEVYVWPWPYGDIRGQSIEPLHRSVPDACLKDKKLYEMLSLVDAIRMGRKREQQLAVKELNKRI